MLLIFQVAFYLHNMGLSVISKLFKWLTELFGQVLTFEVLSDATSLL